MLSDHKFKKSLFFISEWRFYIVLWIKRVTAILAHKTYKKSFFDVFLVPLLIPSWLGPQKRKSLHSIDDFSS